MTVSICPIDGCISAVLPGRYLCRPHWFGTPKPLRDEIWRTWRIIQGHRRSDKTPEQKLADIRAYRDAQKAVEQYWSER